jgi:hypothetical protein
MSGRGICGIRGDDHGSRHRGLVLSLADDARGRYRALITIFH